MSKNTDKLIKALGGFLGRALGNIVVGLVRAVIQALVLGYPLKWLWNHLAAVGLLKGVINLGYWDAFKFILLVAYLSKMSVTRRNADEKED